MVALDFVVPCPAIRCALAEAPGSILATPIDAPCDLPPFRNAAMDGFAVDTAQLEPDGDAWVAVGASPISTGQRVPDAFDAVVPLERAASGFGDRIRISGPVRVGDHVRSRGEELRAGARVLAAGSRLTPAAIGLLAGLGYRAVDIVRPPRVGLLISGDELAELVGLAARRVRRDEQIHDANGPMLGALVAAAGGQVARVVTLGDEPQAIEAALQGLTETCDLVLTSGGASVGRRDHLPAAVDRIGRVVLRQLALRPGRPTCLGLLGSVPVVVLPGNPLALLVGYEVLGRPMLRRLAGDASPLRRKVTAWFAPPAAVLTDRWQAVPVRLDRSEARVIATPAGGSGSAMLSGAATADGLAFLAPAVRTPADVEVELW